MSILFKVQKLGLQGYIEYLDKEEVQFNYVLRTGGRVWAHSLGSSPWFYNLYSRPLDYVIFKKCDRPWHSDNVCTYTRI